MVVCASILIYQAFIGAPTSDEMGHLVSGLAIVQTSDAAFYRVNPPLHKLISGLVVDGLFDTAVGNPYPASFMRSGRRLEFRMASDFIALHAQDYRRFFVVGRLVRIPLVLLAAWMLYRMCGQGSQQAGWVASVLFLTSPMTLGHGWAIMPDSIAAVMMVGLLKVTLGWLRDRDFASFMMVGCLWGLALGTKFTFCPLFLVWPVGLALAQAIGGHWSWHQTWRLPLAHLGHGVVAWVILISLYNGAQLFMPFDEHGFRSHTMRRLAETFGGLPSPLPMQYLVGIDEQTLDLERGYPTYVLGTWYPDGVAWYYAVGMLIKEQLAFVFLGIAALVSFAISVWQLAFARFRQTVMDEDRSIRTPRCMVLALFTFATIFILLSANRAMALNVRYLLPALPAIYLVIGIFVERLWRVFPKTHLPMLWVTALLVMGEIGITFPHHFAYANPLFGGSYRVPPALHDSNFDGGQDLWLVEKWLKKNRPKLGVQRYHCLHSHLPLDAIDVDIRAPSLDVLRRLIESRADGAATGAERSGSTKVEIIAMRGLGVPAPWTKLLGGTHSRPSDELKALLLLPPDEWITPTVAIYRHAVMDRSGRSNRPHFGSGVNDPAKKTRHP